MDISISYRGIHLDLEGDYIQAYSGGYEEQSMMVCYETHEVYAGGVLITNLLTEEQLTDIDELASESLR